MNYLTNREMGRWKNLNSWINFSLSGDIKAARKSTRYMGTWGWTVRFQILNLAV